MDFNFKIFLKFIFVFISVLGCGEARQKILLTSLPVLTLYRGSYTEGYKPIKQLECIGGTASGMHSPKVVQCYNKGSDGRDVQWECKAELPVEYEFGRIEVSCEGFDYPEDPYVVVGSCGQIWSSKRNLSLTFKIFLVQLRKNCFISCHCIHCLLSLYNVFFIGWFFNFERRRRKWWPDDRRPPPPGWNPPPPSYDDATTNQNYYSNKGPSTSSGSGGPGFFSGLGLGALGGYLFGSSGNYGGGYGYGYDGYGSRYRGRPSYFGSSSGYSGGGCSSSSSSSGGTTHTSSGFGGTSRR
uniref:Store-operated calcium entry-associated regulatory factor n=1 Tax=Meloidogyne incognita TaxID=6306 RepID=A0A914MXI2_MELIC